MRCCDSLAFSICTKGSTGEELCSGHVYNTEWRSGAVGRDSFCRIWLGDSGSDTCMGFWDWYHRFFDIGLSPLYPGFCCKRFVSESLLSHCASYLVAFSDQWNYVLATTMRVQWSCVSLLNAQQSNYHRLRMLNQQVHAEFGRELYKCGVLDIRLFSLPSMVTCARRKRIPSS